jgi:hypothetical protein
MVRRSSSEIERASSTRKTRTDGNGEFIFHSVEPGDYYLHAKPSSRRYCEVGAIRVSVPLRRRVLVRLIPGRKIEGVVVAPGNEVISGYMIAVVHQRTYFAPNSRVAVGPGSVGHRLGPDGGFRFEGLAPGRYLVLLVSYRDSDRRLYLSPTFVRAGAVGVVLRPSIQQLG